MLEADAATRTPQTRTLDRKPWAEILAAASVGHADLIVLGVRGRNPVDVVLFGSTANQLVRRETCPVLTTV